MNIRGVATPHRATGCWVQRQTVKTMGQKNGKAAFEEGAVPFVNLSFAALERLWEAFNDVADGFGVSQYEMEEICSELMDELNVNRTKMNEKTAGLFRLLDTDANDLIDALEFLAASALLSGMPTRDKLEFILNAYDFDGSQELSIDEVTLAMKSTLTGLCKMSRDRMPREEELEVKAMHCFEAVLAGEGDSGGGSGKVYIGRVIEWAADDPEVKSWLDYFDDAPERDWVVYPMQRLELDFESEGAHPTKTASEAADMGMDPFVFNEPANVKMAKQGWTNAIASLQPTAYADSRPDLSVPDTSLELEWVHGYRSEDAKSNVRYTASGEMVWHASRVGVIYNALEHRQRFYMGHPFEITAFAMHPNKRLVATGEAGASKPCITVWDTETLQAVATLTGFHQRSIEQLAFSADGARLCAVGGDKDHSLSIYSWARRKRVFSGMCGERKVLDCCFGEGENVVTCGVNHIHFWVKEGANTVKRRGVFGQTGKVQALTCLAPCGVNMLSGTVDGHIYVWLGRNCMRSIRAHTGCVNTLFTSPHGIVSGGKDRKVKLWTLSLEAGATFDMSAFGSNPSVRSACLSQDGTRLLVGTKGSEIFEISAADGSDLQGGPITAGHYAGQLRGVAVHPMKPEFATVGDDGTLRIWDIYTRNLVKSTVFDTALTCVAYHPNGDLVIVGMGGPLGGYPKGKDKKSKMLQSKKDGAFVVLNEPDLTATYEARDSKVPLTACKFSPDGIYMAVSSEDNAIYLYATNEDYESIGKCRRHTAPVKRFDFSEDSKYLQSVGEDKELYFFNAGTAQSMGNLSAMKDIKFPPQTAMYGWGTAGSFPAVDNGTEITATGRSFSGNVLAAGDNFGNLKLFRFPCWSLGAACHEFRAHGAAIGDVVFSNEDSHVITLGAHDRSLMQWRHKEDPVVDDADVVDEPESDDYALELRDGSDLDKDAETEAAIDRNQDLLLALLEKPFLEEPGGGSSSLAAAVGKPLEPWREMVAEPSVLPLPDKSVPKDSLRLEWVHGYRAQDCRQNLCYTASGAMVYPATQLVVRLDATQWQQKFMTEHSDEVSAVSVSPDRKLVASAQQGRRPSIVIWDASTMTTLQVLRGFHKRSIIALTWSPDSRLIASVGCDDDHSLAVHDWRDDALLAKAKVSKRKVLDLAFGGPGGDRLVTCGVKNVAFWQLHRGGRHLRYEKGLISTKGKLQAFLCCAWVDDTAVVGSGDGHLYVFAPVDGKPSRTLTVTRKAHDDMVNAIKVFPHGVVTGGKDGMVKLWSRDLGPLSDFDIRECKPCLYPRVRSVDVSLDEKRILVGTQGGEIFEMDMVDGKNMHDGPLVQSHFKGELRGLAVHPLDPIFATVGDDATLRLWSLADMKVRQAKELDSPARSVAFSPDGRLVCVGLGKGGAKATRDGAYMVFNASDLSVMHEGRDSQEWVRELCFSPDGRRLACATQDNQVFIYDTSDGFARTAVMNAHQAPVNALDWSDDSLYTMSTDEAAVLQFADALSGVQIPVAAALKDTQWANQTCALGWASQGLHGPKAKATGDKVLSLDRSRSGKLFAVGDNFGRVKLVNAPTYEQGHGEALFRGHSGSVGKVRWSAGDTHLLSVGGKDRCVFQWRVEPEMSTQEGDAAGDSGDDSAVERDCGLGSLRGMSDYSELVKEADQTQLAEGGGGGASGGSKKKKDAGKQVKPWVNRVVPPSKVNPEMELGDAPPLGLELDFAYGARCGDVRNCVRYNCYTDVVFPCAASGVIYTSSSHSQRFHTGHQGDVVALAMSESGLVVATADAAVVAQGAADGESEGGGGGGGGGGGFTGVTPTVRVWDALTGKILCALPRFHATGVSQLCFSKDGRWLASVGQDEHHSVAVYLSPNGTWAESSVTRVASAAGPSAKILFALFSGPEAFPLMIGGDKHVEFLDLNGQTLARTVGVFGKRKKIQPMLCGADLNAHTVVCGTITGHLYEWDKAKKRCDKQTRAHEGPVYAMAKDGTGLITGGKDGFVILWDAELRKTKTFSILDVHPLPVSSAIHSVCTDPLGMKMLVATKSGDVFEIVKDTAASILLNESHATKELHALAPHPVNADRFATAGDDGAVRIWSAKRRLVLYRSTPDLIGSAVRALCWSPDGAVLVCGCGGDSENSAKDGAIVVLEIMASSGALEVKHEDRKAKKAINDIKYSPQGNAFVVSSEDGRVYVHEAADFSLRTVCTKTPTPVKSIDWSLDGKYLQGVTRGLDLVFFDVATGKPLATPAIVRDASWATTTVPVGFNVQGVWPGDTPTPPQTSSSVDGGGVVRWRPPSVDVQTVDRSKSERLLAMGDDAGNVEVFFFPCTHEKESARAVGGHATHVTKVRFTEDDAYLITIGGFNRSIIQYKFKRLGADENGVGVMVTADADLPSQAAGGGAEGGS